jgi:tetratricopeptide (TPR) repeat protein
VIFISHSHSDRHAATDLQKTIEAHGAKTYFDQDRIGPGDHLPEKIRDLIDSCDTFFLIWSAEAASSAWVKHEWNMAYDLRKKIIPYCLDSTPLPPSLENLVYIDSKDRDLGDAQLLTTIFGEGFAPDTYTLFPGHWQASANVSGIMEVTFDIELRKNGQVEGSGGLGQGGVMATELATELESVGLRNMRIPFHGNWSYDKGTEMLTINSVVTVMGREDRETIRIRTTGREKGSISGQDLGGRTWTLRRQTELHPESISVQQSVNEAEKLKADDLYKKGIALWNGTGYSDPRLAIDYFTQAAHLLPQVANIYHSRGIAQLQLGLYKEALADFNRSISLGSDDAECYNWRGNTYYMLKDMSNARKDWEKACEMGSMIACQNLKNY